VIIRFALMLAFHYLADFWLQSGASSRLKRHESVSVRWRALIQHGATHGVLVALVTGWPLLGLAETVIHAVIDRAKARGWIGTAGDQVAHVACKIAWLAALAALGGR
jgi:hypothetical protein